MDANAGVIAEPLFVALTRPPLRMGVTDSALIVNAVLTTELFLLTRNPLTFLVAIPIHGLCALACVRDPGFFDLGVLWLRTRVPAYFGNFKWWASSSYSPLSLDLPDVRGRRRNFPNVRVANALYVTPRTRRGD